MKSLSPSAGAVKASGIVHSSAQLRWLLASFLFVGLSLMPGLFSGGSLASDKGDEKDDEGYVNFSKDHPTGTVKPDKALVYVVRPTSMGFAIKSFFLCDDEILGINRGSSYFFVQVDPGKHVFWSRSENVDAMELQVEGGHTYYIQQHVKMGGFRARTKLDLLDEATGKEALSDCKKHGTLTDQGRAKGREIAREYRKDTQEDLDRRAREAAEDKK